jgi:ABC-2 type transport system ATP-binding protein
MAVNSRISTSDTVLQVEGLVKKFDGRTALDTITFDMQKGEVFGLLGPNGAGKTTLIRTILDIFRPDTGKMLILGAMQSDAAREQIGYLPEEGNLNRELTVSECIRFFAELKHVRDVDEKMDAWLRRMDLLEYKNRKIVELSKGMHRRLQFVIAVIHEPEILILDEPFSGLDPINIQLLKEALSSLVSGGMTILMSTHQMDEVERMCDRILMINKGRTVLYGKIDAIKERFGSSVLVWYEGTLPGIGAVPKITDYGNYAELTLATGTDPQEIVREIIGKVAVRKLEIRQRSMNEIFIEVCKND